jgi:hypothetical protein
VTERLRVREIDDDEGRLLVRIVRRGSRSVVTWRRAQMVLLSAPGMDVSVIAKVAFTSEDRVRDVIRNFNADGFGSLYPKYRAGRRSSLCAAAGRPRRSPSPGRPSMTCRSPGLEPVELAEFLVAEGVVDDISHEGLRVLLRDEGVTLQRLWPPPTISASRAHPRGHLLPITGRQMARLRPARHRRRRHHPAPERGRRPDLARHRLERQPQRRGALRQLW